MGSGCEFMGSECGDMALWGLVWGYGIGADLNVGWFDSVWGYGVGVGLNVGLWGGSGGIWGRCGAECGVMGLSAGLWGQNVGLEGYGA